MSEIVLVTGGAGFIGAPTVARLLDAGHEVVVVDNFSVGSLERLAPLRRHKALDIVELDLRDAKGTAVAVGEIGARSVIHLAAHHFIPFCKAHPADTIDVNVGGTQHLLDALVPVAPERVLFASTADVYAAAPFPHVETDPTEPDNIYGMSKLMGERLMQFHSERAPKTDVVNVRFFNAVGPGETNPHLVPDILDHVRAGDELPLGNTDTRRDYVHTEDMAEALARLLGGPDGSFTVNLGTGVSWDATDIVHFMAQLLDRTLVINTDPAKVRRSDRQNLQASARRLEMLLPGFRTKSLRETLASTLSAEGFALAPAAVPA
ncbi:MAG: NAD(P)-dependent oxidoreductase [Actinomycetia bacterium]|nr:NAD(P)-dependent oxidoreductase [Actinomycetes bacterium]MCP4960996.1 NAD(P)-dependent oxidoreductase [Actinomycetes bacterium]